MIPSTLRFCGCFRTGVIAATQSIKLVSMPDFVLINRLHRVVEGVYLSVLSRNVLMISTALLAKMVVEIPAILQSS